MVFYCLIIGNVDTEQDDDYDAVYDSNPNNIYGDPTENLDEIIQNPYYEDGLEKDNQIIKKVENPYYDGDI